MAIQGASPSVAPAVTAQTTQAPAAPTATVAPAAATAQPAQPRSADQFSAKPTSSFANITGGTPMAPPPPPTAMATNSLAVTQEEIARLTSDQQGSLLRLLDSMKSLSEEDKGKLLDTLIELLRFIGKDLLDLMNSILESVKAMGAKMSAAASAEGGDQGVQAPSGGDAGEAPLGATSTGNAPAQELLGAPQAQARISQAPAAAAPINVSSEPGEEGPKAPGSIAAASPGTGSATGVLVDPTLQGALDAIATDDEGGKLLRAAKAKGLESVTVNPLLNPSGGQKGWQGVTWKMPNGKQRIEIANPHSWDVVRTLTHELGHAATAEDKNSKHEEGVVDQLGINVQARVAKRSPGYALDPNAYAKLPKTNAVAQTLAQIGINAPKTSIA